jgi:hypothetical protein
MFRFQNVYPWNLGLADSNNRRKRPEYCSCRRQYYPKRRLPCMLTGVEASLLTRVFIGLVRLSRGSWESMLVGPSPVEGKQPENLNFAANLVSRSLSRLSKTFCSLTAIPLNHRNLFRNSLRSQGATPGSRTRASIVTARGCNALSPRMKGRLSRTSILFMQAVHHITQGILRLRPDMAMCASELAKQASTTDLLAFLYRILAQPLLLHRRGKNNSKR